MIKKQVLLAVTLAATTLVRGQTSLELPSSYINNNTYGGINNLPPDIEGSPYLRDEFVKGTVFVENEKPYAAMMRYNAYQDEIQVQGSDGISSLFKRDYIWAEIGGETFRIQTYGDRTGTSKGYFVELNRGNIRLLKRIVREFKEGQPAVSSYSQNTPPRFDEKVTYYLVREESPAREVRLRKKDILGFLSSKEVETYVKENKLRLNSEKEVIQVLTQINAG
ncbi:MAG: hypothetical protein JSW57_00975 [Flavobacteriaceae bacterium]|jgi:hypothetical protein|nr:MAG: hypothetical protein JSW57_00975 [Flavobacteriaceae bacterium]